MIVANYDLCGGIITVDWDFTDNCSRNIHHTQVITIEPAPVADWINPPATSLNISCEEAQNFTAPNLNYTNGEIGNCEIAGTVIPTITTNYDECGGSITVIWEFTDDCNRTIAHTQNVIVQPAPTAQWISPPPTSLNISCKEAQNFAASNLDYTNGEIDNCEIAGTVAPTVTTNYNECGGSITVLWEYTDNCNRTIAHTQNVTVQPAPIAQWISTPPTSLNISCEEAQNFTAPNLDYTNGEIDNCEIAGTVVPTVTTNYNECGGSITVLWEYTDDCNRTIAHTQNVTVQPAPTAQWINPPPTSISLSCEEASNYTIPDLAYSNGETGNCEIAGSAPGSIQSGSFNECGGTQLITWSFTDNCGNRIEYTQEITVAPAPAAQWINPPTNITLSCEEAETYTIPNLAYSNNQSGVCAIEGTAVPNISGSFTECGGTQLITWSFTDNCGNQIEHAQEITIEPAPQAQWINPPSNTTITCEEAVNYEIPTLFYSNNQSGICAIEGSTGNLNILSGSFDECGGEWNIEWEAIDDCGRILTHTQNISIEPAPVPEWINPPASLSMTCKEAENYVPPILNYSNNLLGICGIEGSVSPEVTGSYDLCGGNLTIIWSTTDVCGRMITHIQEIEVTPAPAPEWINPLGSISMTCEEAENYVPPNLNYFNQSVNGCEIYGTATPIIANDFNECGGNITIEWEATDDCGRNIYHQQTITVGPAQKPEWINPPTNLTLSCLDADSYLAPDLTYTNNLEGICRIEGIITPTVQKNYNACGGEIVVNWTTGNSCGVPLTHSITIEVEPEPEPAFLQFPESLSLTCAEADEYIPIDLPYSNNSSSSCVVEGVVAPIINRNYTYCGGTMTVVWNYTDDCGYSLQHEQIITVNPAPEAQWIAPPGKITLTCNEAATYLIPDLAYSNGESGSCEIQGAVAGQTSSSLFDVCGGTQLINWTFTDECGRTITHTQEIEVLPATPASWVDATDEITISCEEAANFDPPQLRYSNNEPGSCLDEGSVTGTISGNFNACGGNWSIFYEYTDECGHRIEHTQKVNIQPAPVLQWINPPTDLTLTCAEAENFQPNPLAYDNGEMSICQISGTAEPLVTRDFDKCGGLIQITWSFTDDCGYFLFHEQTITITPTPIPVWVNPPADQTISCAEAETYTIPELGFTNNESNNCLINGTVAGTRTGSYDECGGTWTIEWTATDECERTIRHEQVITILPAPPPQWGSPPGDITLTCEEAETFQPSVLAYSNGAPESCLIEGIAEPTVQKDYDACGGNITVFWEHEDDCGNQISHQQNITIEPASAPQWVEVPQDLTLSCTEANAFVPSNLNYTNNVTGLCAISGSVAPIIQNNFGPCGGEILITWNLENECGEINLTAQQVITVLPLPEPEWVTLPTLTTLECAEAYTFLPPSLPYTNGETGDCQISGSIAPQVQNNFTACGGTIDLTWNYTDSCGFSLLHTASITVLPAKEATWESALPADQTITCEEAANFTPATLSYSNQSVGACTISGTVTGTTNADYDLCGGSITVNWATTDDCGRSLVHQQIITVEPATPASWINPPSSLTISCAEAANFQPIALSYSNQLSGNCLDEGSISGVVSGHYTQCGGALTVDWTYTDFCGRTIDYQQAVKVAPASEPEWIQAPGDDTLSCEAAFGYLIPALEYTNNSGGICAISGSVTGVSTANFNTCGGEIVDEWTWTDSCGRTINHRRVLTVKPLPEPEWINPPADLTLTCEEIETYLPPSLNYSNNLSGACQVAGTVEGVLVQNRDACGGTASVTWTATDDCGQTITYQQNISIVPSAEPELLNPPADLSLTCQEVANFVPEVLSYSNRLNGDCLTEGTISPVVTTNTDECGGTITVAWNETTACGRVFSQQQTITVLPPEPPVWTSLPTSENLSCSEAENFAAPTLDFTNGGTGICLIEGTVEPTYTIQKDACGGQITATWNYQDACGTVLFHEVTYPVDPAPEPVWTTTIPDQLTLTCEEFANRPIPELTYDNFAKGICQDSGSVAGQLLQVPDACGGEAIIQWEYTTSCGAVLRQTQTIEVLPPPEIEWINAVPSQTITCEEANQYQIPDLSYDNGGSGNCRLTGSAPGVRSGTYDVCGGEWNIIWAATDDCGRVSEFVQTITILPAAAASWINPPEDAVLTCSEAADFVIPNLEVSNNENDGCEIYASVAGIRTGSYDACGGSWTITWTYTDACERTITHTQNIAIQPLNPGNVLELPQDTVLSCAAADSYQPQPILYSNEDEGICQLNVEIIPSVKRDYTACGGTLIAEWEWTDPCGNVFLHQQNITVEAEQPAVWINPPADTSIQCLDLPPFLSRTLPYTNNSVCEISGEVVPTITSSNYNACGGTVELEWNLTDPCGRTLSHRQTITVLPAAPPAFDDLPADINLTCEELAVYVPPALTYSNGNIDPCGLTGSIQPSYDFSNVGCTGTVNVTWDGVTDCGLTLMHVQEITVSPPEEPSFVNLPPATVTINCDNAGLLNASTLAFDNGVTENCRISGTVLGQLSGSFNACGGTLTMNWDTTTACGKVLSYTQEITVLPVDPPVWTNLPEPAITLSCAEANTFNPPSLSYSSTTGEGCTLEGSVAPVVTGSHNTCGGNYQVEWTYADECGNALSYTQEVTVEAASPAQWTTLPNDTTLSCAEAVNYTAPILTYANTDPSGCQVQGTASPNYNPNYDACGGTITVDWVTNDECGRVLTYQIIVTVEPAADPIPLIDQLSLDSFIDYNTALSYGSGVPNLPFSNQVTDNSCLITGTLLPSLQNNFDECGGSIAITWNGTTPCGVPINYSHTVAVTPAEAPVVFLEDSLYRVCEEANFNIRPTIVNPYDNMAYQWEKSSDGLTFSPITNANSLELNFANLSTAEEGFYRLVYGNANTNNECIFTSPVLSVEVLRKSYSSISATICNESTFDFNGTMLNQSGTYQSVLTNAAGCDSIIDLTLTVQAPKFSNQNAHICAGEVYDFFGQGLTVAGDYEQVISTIEGCDSTVYLALTVGQPNSFDFEITLCQGLTYDFNGTILSSPGIYVDTLINAEQCDSVVTLTVNYTDAWRTSISDTICEGTSFDFYGRPLGQSGIYRDTLTASGGCDSIITLDLFVIPTVKTTYVDTICEGEQVIFSGGIYNQTVIDTLFYAAASGCDSLAIIDLTVLENKTGVDNYILCAGTSVTYEGVVLDGNQTRSFTLVAANGCDSVVSVTVQTLEEIRTAQEATICEGETFEFYGRSLTNPGAYTEILTAANGCDSTIVLNLTVLENLYTQVDLSYCQYDSLEVNGQFYNMPVTFIETFTAENGCDSFVTYQITEIPQLDLLVQDYTICANEQVRIGVLNTEPLDLTWEAHPSLSCTQCNEPLADPAVTTTYYVSAVGCGGKIIRDSITVYVDPLPGLQPADDVIMIRGEPTELLAQTDNPDAYIDWTVENELICSDCERVMVNFEKTTQVEILASNDLGCIQTTYFTVYVEDPCGIDKIEFANALTPNGDGFNDYFEIRNYGDAQINQVLIYTRWGEKVFESRDMNQKWDGRIGGQIANPGVFLYLVKGICKNGQDEFNLTGNVTLLQ